MIKRSTLILLAICLSFDFSNGYVRTQKPELVFNGDGKVVLALSKPLTLEILEKSSKSKNGVVSAKFTLPDTSKADVTGSMDGSNFVLDIKFKGEIKGDDTAKLTQADLKFEITNDVSSGYWTLKALTGTYVGSIDDKTPININKVYDVDSNPGVTSSQADNIFGRGHLTGAPKNLCWFCDKQVFKGKDTSSRLTMPGARLQPVLTGGNSSTTSLFRFGYEWDCDPLIPLSVWVGILLTLTLATFLYWAIDMLTSLQTPNRFDDPRGKPLNVPTSD